MGRIRNNQRGFSVIEVLLALILVALIVLIGLYVVHNHKTSSSKSTTTSAPTSMTLSLAVAQTQAVYALFTKDVYGGQVLKDKSQWATNNVDAAEDLQFINANPQLFTSSFIASANKDEANNITPPGSEFFMCMSGSAEFNFTPGFQVTGDSLIGQAAKVTLNYTTGRSAPSTKYTIPVTLQYSGDSWKIDSINLSSCPQ